MKEIASVHPYTPLEVVGRDIYIREGCYNCHSQLVRPFRYETERYGEYSKAGEYVYDHPFQWGSKRTGPDLHRVGGKYPSLWHVRHMPQPSSTTPGSVMPRYPHLLTERLRHQPDRVEDARAARRSACRTPTARSTRRWPRWKRRRRRSRPRSRRRRARRGSRDKEIVALTAYLQRLGTDIKWKRPAAAQPRRPASWPCRAVRLPRRQAPSAAPAARGEARGLRRRAGANSVGGAQ